MMWSPKFRSPNRCRLRQSGKHSMCRIKHIGLVWSLLACLILMNGLLAAPGVAHAEHHASHTATTHSTGLCAWQCVAAQGIEASSVCPKSTRQLIHLVASESAIQFQRLFSSLLFLRGPPA